MLNVILIAVVIVSLIGLGFVLTPQAESNIPPTPAFSTVAVNGQKIEAQNYNDQLNIVTQGDLTMSKSSNTITIKIRQVTCPALQGVIAINSTGHFVCGAV